MRNSVLLKSIIVESFESMEERKVWEIKKETRRVRGGVGSVHRTV